MIWLAWFIVVAVFIVSIIIQVGNIRTYREYDVLLNKSVKYVQDSIDEINRLQREVRRLKRGDFTEEEFQTLCHNLNADDRSRFEQGCREYQKKLFEGK